MISYIRGPLAEKFEDSVVIEAGNVGYRIFVPISVLEGLPGLGEEVKLYTYFQVSETGMSLYGFCTKQDLEMFRQLIGVNGVGPRSALGILSSIRPDALRLAVLSSDVKALTKAPGVGAKTAQRIILDLKDKVKAEDLLVAADAVPAAGDASGLSGFDEAAREAAEALTALGYSADEASQAVRKAAAEGMTAEEILKASLKYLAF